MVGFRNSKLVIIFRALLSLVLLLLSLLLVLLLVYLGEIGWGCVDWIYLAQDRDKWRAFVTTGMKLLVSQKCWEFLESLHNCWYLK
jgi:hypothetical protein